MTVIALTSTRGAPGVTTTALALTLAWPRAAMLVEADVSGSSSIKAGHLRGDAEPEPNIVNLAIAHRNNALTLDAIRDVALELPLNRTRLVLPGVASSIQVGSLTNDFWETLAVTLHALTRRGVDVIIDAGRRGMTAGPEPLLRSADLVAVVTRTRLDDIVSVASNVAQLRGPADVAVERLGAILVGEGSPYRAADVKKATGLQAWASMAYDPVNADRLSGGKEILSTARLDRSPLMRSAKSTVNGLQKVLDRRADLLSAPTRSEPSREESSSR